MARFVAIDVETANARRASICQIGLVVYENRKIVDEWSTLIDPEEEFNVINVINVINVGIHGIGRKSVASAPTLPAVYAEVARRVSGGCVASYGDFDRSAFLQAGTRYSLPALDAQWLDLQHVVKGAWPPEFTADGWALKKICAQLGVDLTQHHDALADARAAGDVFVMAQERTGTWAREWLVRTRGATPLSNPVTRARAIAPSPDVGGALAGTRIVFTGG